MGGCAVTILDWQAVYWGRYNQKSGKFCRMIEKVGAEFAGLDWLGGFID